MHTGFAAGEYNVCFDDVSKVLNSVAVVVSVSIKTRFELGIPNVLLTLLGTSHFPVYTHWFSLYVIQVLLSDLLSRTGLCLVMIGTGKVALCGQTSCGIRARSHDSCGSMSLYVS